MKLTRKQLLFVDTYMANGMNAKKAAEVAGWKAATAGSVQLANPFIKAEIEKRSKAVTERCEITNEYILNGIQTLIERCSEQIPVLNRKGEQVYVEGPTGELVAAYTTFDPKTAMKGHELLGKYKKLFTDRVEVSGNDGGPIQTTPVTAEDAARWYQEKMRNS